MASQLVKALGVPRRDLPKPCHTWSGHLISQPMPGVGTVAALMKPPARDGAGPVQCHSPCWTLNRLVQVLAQPLTSYGTWD